MNQSEKTKLLNDQLRKQLIGGKIVLTRGVTAKGEETVRSILYRVTEYRDFTPDNDPHQEHDFGAFSHAGEKYFWKIDYYDLSYQCLSQDPSNSEITNRVLTIMLASEH